MVVFPRAVVDAVLGRAGIDADRLAYLMSRSYRSVDVRMEYQ